MFLADDSARAVSHGAWQERCIYPEQHENWNCGATVLACSSINQAPCLDAAVPSPEAIEDVCLVGAEDASVHNCQVYQLRIDWTCVRRRSSPDANNPHLPAGLYGL